MVHGPRNLQASPCQPVQNILPLRCIYTRSATLFLTNPGLQKAADPSRLSVNENRSALNLPAAASSIAECRFQTGRESRVRVDYFLQRCSPHSPLCGCWHAFVFLSSRGSRNPVAPLLTQLAPGTAFEDLERAVFGLEPQVVPALHS